MIKNFPTMDGFTAALGTIYQFPLNITDALSLPRPEWTTIYARHVVSKDTAPSIWRAAAVNPAVVVEVENLSDAGLRTMREEAVDCWENMRLFIKAKAKWFKLIGVHPTVQERALEPTSHRQIQIFTLQDDYLARMFALGTQEVAAMAGLLHSVESAQANEPIGAITLEEFLWPVEDELEPWQQKRYDAALIGGYCAVQSSFAQS